jgi:hypothetical protein
MPLDPFIRKLDLFVDLPPTKNVTFDFFGRFFYLFCGRNRARAVNLSGGIRAYLVGIDYREIVETPERVGHCGVFLIHKVLMLVFEDEFVGVGGLKVKLDLAEWGWSYYWWIFFREL